MSRFLWAPRLGWLGIQRIHVLPDVVVLAGAGVGGGSLVYANTLYRPSSDAFFADPQWAGITDWRAELAPYYDQASRMLGVVDNPTCTPADDVVRRAADDLGVGASFRLAPVGVVFGDARRARARPVLRRCGAGAARLPAVRRVHDGLPARRQEHLADELPVAGRAGRRARGRRDHRDVRSARAGTSGRSGPPGRAGAGATGPSRPGRWCVAAGTWGTQELLHRMKADGTLPALSDRLGALTRTNSESLGGAATRWRGWRRRPDMTRGVAITSSVYLDERTHLEPVRYGRGSNLMGLLSTVLTDGGGRVPRPLRWAGNVVRHPGQVASLLLGLRQLVAAHRHRAGHADRRRRRSPCGRAGRGAGPSG